jgi:ribonuclease T2
VADEASFAEDERSQEWSNAAPSADGADQGGECTSDAPGDFDYYLLALSWSPTYCAQPESAERAPLQCGSDRPYAFIVHGLWPQHERGWPRSCPAGERGDDVPRALKDDMLDLMPSPALIESQWDRHGTCTGDTQEAYFQTTRALREAIAIPQTFTRLSEPLRITGQEVEDAFVQANPGLSDEGVAVICNRGRLREVRLCFTREGDFRSCGADVRDTCGEEPVTMPPVRVRRG